MAFDPAWQERARGLIGDLFRRSAAIYWTDLLLSSAAAWALTVVYFTAPAWSALQVFAFLGASVLFFRVGTFIHEIVHMPGGHFTDHVFGKMKERDILRFEGPLGSFFLREESDKPVIMVASGTGFAPVKGIIEHTLYRGIKRPITLYWGGRRPQDIYLMDLCKQWAGSAPHIRFIPVVSDALAEDHWSGRTGFVHRAAIADFPDMSGHQVYACGAPIVIDSARADFITQCKLPEDEFYADSFTTEADLAKTA